MGNSLSTRCRLGMTECDTYEEAKAEAALRGVIDSIGGLDWVEPGMKIGVKLNLCAAKAPEAAATTHPALVKALVKMLRERGAEPVIGDSPGGPFNPAMMNRTYTACGMKDLEKDGVVLNSVYEHLTVEFPEAVSIKQFDYVKWMYDCDAIINFCKLKSHGLMGITAAIKNLYGVIPGTYKSEYHFRHQDPADFANLLVDLNEYVKPKLCLCDAIDIMEGNGPTMGNPRHMGLILASDNPYEMDRLCAELLGVKESEIPFLIAARNRGLSGNDDYKAAAAKYRIPDFVRSGATACWFTITGEETGLRKIIKKGLYIAMSSKPETGSDCIGCGKCKNGCPADAITITNGKAVIDRKKCVKCFCCQEFCPVGAMKVKRSPIAKFLGK